MPFVSTWLVVGLLLASVGIFIGLVHSLTRLQITSVLAFTGDFARQIIDVVYPPMRVTCAGWNRASLHWWPVTQRMLYSGPPRAIQSLDIARLTALAEQVDGVIEMLSAVGDTVVAGTPLLRVYGGRRAIERAGLEEGYSNGYPENLRAGSEVLYPTAPRHRDSGIVSSGERSNDSSPGARPDRRPLA